MKPRTQYFIAIGLIILVFGMALFTFSMRAPAAIQTFPATINRDCAPWDGSAFTVSIPLNDGTIVNISIYQSPNVRLPVTFSFPDESMTVGNALLLLPVGLPEQLTGKVWFKSVDEGKPVHGGFNLLPERGERFEGKFIAEWENQPVYCG